MQGFCVRFIFRNALYNHVEQLLKSNLTTMLLLWKYFSNCYLKSCFRIWSKLTLFWKIPNLWESKHLSNITRNGQISFFAELKSERFLIATFRKFATQVDYSKQHSFSTQKSYVNILAQKIWLFRSWSLWVAGFYCISSAIFSIINDITKFFKPTKYRYYSDKLQKCAHLIHVLNNFVETMNI